MYKYTAVPTGNLDQRWGHGIWVGMAPMTDEHIILTESGVQKVRSLHRVPLEERLLIRPTTVAEEKSRSVSLASTQKWKISSFWETSPDATHIVLLSDKLS